VVSVDEADGPVAVSVHPWEIALERAIAEGSAQNHLPARVVSVTVIGNRARVGLEAPQPLTAEVTTESVRRLALAEGERVHAVWKATATRLTAR
jgi:molybdate transport system ATP-binding protein